jgi:hypothetical protein
MSFICEFCGQSSAPGTPAHKVVTARREVRYPPRYRCNRPVWEESAGKKRPRPKSGDDPGGVGWEVVREALACADCARGRGS